MNTRPSPKWMAFWLSMTIIVMLVAYHPEMLIGQVGGGGITRWRHSHKTGDHTGGIQTNQDLSTTLTATPTQPTFLVENDTGNVYASGTFFGDGSGLTGLPASATPTLQAVTDAGNSTTNEIIFASGTSGGGFGSTGLSLTTTGDAVGDGYASFTTYFGDGSNLTGILSATSTLQEVTDAGNTTTNWIQIQNDLFASGSAHLGGGFGSTGCSVNDFNGRLQCDGNVETQGSYGGGGCRLGTHLQCDGSIWASGTYYGDGSGLTGLISTSTLQDALDNGNTGALTADDTMELTGTSTYRTLIVDHGLGNGNALEIDNSGSGDSISIKDDGVELFYITYNGEINATKTFTSRHALSSIKDYAFEVHNPSYFREGGNPSMSIGGRSLYNGSMGLRYEDPTSATSRNYGVFLVTNTSSSDARNIYTSRSNSSGANVEFINGNPVARMYKNTSSGTVLEIENMNSNIALEINYIGGAYAQSNTGLLDIDTGQRQGDIVHIDYSTYDQAAEAAPTMFALTSDWVVTTANKSYDMYGAIFDINIEDDFTATSPTGINTRQVFDIDVDSSSEGMLFEIDSSGSGGIMDLTETNTGSASDTVIISNAGTGYSTTWEDAGVAVLSVEPDGDILDRTGSYYYMRGETTTPARMEYGRDTVTSASTGSVTFANAFSATPTVTCTFEKNQVAASGASCWTYSTGVSSFVWELSGTMASGTVGWTAVGSN